MLLVFADGDPRNEFFIGRDNGNILLAKTLDWETQHHYNLTVSVTDGVHVVTTHVSLSEYKMASKISAILKIAQDKQGDGST